MYVFNATARHFCIVLLALSGPLQAQFSGRLNCDVDEQNVDGRWIASRYLTVDKGVIVAAQDKFDWKPNASAQSDRGMAMTWDLSYWPMQAADRRPAGLRDAVPENEVVVGLHFRFATPTTGESPSFPRRSRFHLYRSANPQQVFIDHDTSLANQVSWEPFAGGNWSGKALFPLDALLAFGTGHDTLVWNIRGRPDDLGNTRALYEGLLRIAAMRGKLADIPGLRRLLDRKQAAFATECHVPPMAPPMPG